jgi:hypothetical protein
VFETQVRSADLKRDHTFLALDQNEQSTQILFRIGIIAAANIMSITLAAGTLLYDRRFACARRDRMMQEFLL